jgi:hypothetical protein
MKIHRTRSPVVPLQRLADSLARRAPAPAGGDAPRALRSARLGPVLRLDRRAAERLFRLALLDATAGETVARPRAVLWRDGGDTLLLEPSRARLRTGVGVLVVAVPVFTDETGRKQVVLPFVTADDKNAVGFMAATESVPRGPRAIVDRFGDPLLAAAWAALVEVAAAWATAMGPRLVGAPLAVAGLGATAEGLVIPTQRPFDAPEPAR